MTERQYASRLERKLDETGDLTRAQGNVLWDYKLVAMMAGRHWDWLNDLIIQREGESDAEHLERIKAALNIELDEDA